MIKEKTIIDFMEQGKKYEYIGEDFGGYKKRNIYKCYVKLPYMILMSYKGRGVKLALGVPFPYPVNSIENWKEATNE
ncbi:MAG: hypothetical protein ACYDIA_01895 [Candidatus Humimicrobiaceae bacterium]